MIHFLEICHFRIFSGLQLVNNKILKIEGNQRGQYLSGNPVRYNNNQNRGRDDFHQAPNPPPPQTPPPNNPKVYIVEAPLFKPVSEYQKIPVLNLPGDDELAETVRNAHTLAAPY